MQSHNLNYIEGGAEEKSDFGTRWIKRTNRLRHRVHIRLFGPEMHLWRYK